jgi:hypothetical protein
MRKARQRFFLGRARRLPGCLVNQLGYEALPRIGLLAHLFGRKTGAAIADGLMEIAIGTGAHPSRTRAGGGASNGGLSSRGRHD